ncbi:hypothetical protein VNO78_19998 [Psophocarpus tetragonolobus]|uniref:Uncharacterized protein n=1 Tax=Psophocarpus tetragonolobus TaxID=3891 RepID=A0AAN9XGT3_PSOTE
MKEESTLKEKTPLNKEAHGVAGRGKPRVNVAPVRVNSYAEAVKGLKGSKGGEFAEGQGSVKTPSQFLWFKSSVEDAEYLSKAFVGLVERKNEACSCTSSIGFSCNLSVDEAELKAVVGSGGSWFWSQEQSRWPVLEVLPKWKNRSREQIREFNVLPSCMQPSHVQQRDKIITSRDDCVEGAREISEVGMGRGKE